MRRYWFILLWLLLAIPLAAQEDELCINGRLLFREDFGGNEESYPVAGTEPVEGMSPTYHQIYDTAHCHGRWDCVGMGSGRYLLTKIGYRNAESYTWSHWFIMDDHTYPNDYTRGYLLEIDGMSGSHVFYTKRMDGLCSGSKLTFTAYVANVTTGASYVQQRSSYTYPKLSFIITDPRNGSVLARHNTDTIGHDWRFYNTPGEWRNSAEWQLVGMNFTVPEGVKEAELSIINNAEGWSGNDFALDDIEIRLCMPVPTIVSDSVACVDSTYQFAIDFENDGRLAEPLEYKWYYSTGEAMDYSTGSGMIDGNGWWWEEIPNSNTPSLRFEELPANATGWYKIAIASTGNIDDPMNRTESAPFHLRAERCPPPPLECPDGILLFREDFGGNDPSDPTVSHTPVAGMSYTQIYALEPGPTGSMGAGRYLVSKEGYRNSTYSNYSVWHIMDDHTYPDDKTRGYMMEVDGRGGKDAFYRTTLTGICSGSRLTFSAYIANLTTAGQYNGWRNDRDYVHPKLHFVISDMHTGAVIAQQGTDTISHDWSNYPKSWRESAEWQLVGMNFTVPAGTEDIELSIINDVDGSTGNDFAIDDIEIHLCGPTVSMTAPDSVCIDTKNVFTAICENNGKWLEPLQYQWYFSADSLNWEPVSDGNRRELKLKAKPKHTGWYKVAVVAYGGHVEREKCRSESEPHKFYVIDECPPILCPEGVLLLHEESDGTAQSLNTSIDGLCEEMDLSLIINLPAGHAETRLMLRIIDLATGHELRAYDTGDVPSDSLQAGTSFTIPAGVSGLRWTISNNGGSGALPIENIEIRLCMEPIAIGSANPVCRKKRHTMQAVYENYGTLDNPEFRWEFSTDSMVWTELQTGASKMYTIPVVHRSHEGWYRVTVADAGNMDMPNCRETSEPFKLSTQYCNTAVDQYIDTTACDTLLYYDLTWRGHVWPATGTVVDTLRDIDIDDSVYVHKTLQTKICCPDIRTLRVDSAVCDTLLPFLWFYQDTMLLFSDIGEQEIEYPHWRWENCIGEIHTLALDTFHCERLYPIIVNKYNWQLVCNNMELARIFPELHPLEFQWFKDSVAIEGANADDYSEENELHGVFQLRIKLDRTVDNHDEYIWSNILDIHDTPAPAPIIKRVYNSQGIPVSEEQTGSGVYLIHYQQGDRVWTEKKVVL